MSVSELRVRTAHRGSRRGRGLTRRRRKQVNLLPAMFILLTLAMTCVYPLFYLLGTALKSSQEYQRDPLGLPDAPTIDNFSQAWSGAELGRLTLNSCVVVGISVAIVLLLASAAGFSLIHLAPPRRLRSTTRVMSVLLLALPPSAILVPITTVILDLGLSDSYAGLVLVYVGMQLPFGIYMMSSYFDAVPAEILDAARVDGAGAVRQFWSIALPLSKPALGTLGALSALTLWNELLFGLLIIQDPERRTVTAGVSLLQSSFSGAASATVQSAGLLIATTGPILLFVLMNRALIRGLVAGALK